MSFEDLSEDEKRELEKRLLSELNARNGSAGNKALRNAMAGEVIEEDYWEVRDRLLDRGLIELGRGKGGSVRLVEPPPPGSSQPISFDPQPESPGDGLLSKEDTVAEQDSYQPLARVLRESWVKDVFRFDKSIVEVTALQGKRKTGGKWSRPDITIIGVASYKFIPGKHLEVVTFEVKAANAIDITAVYEALAHRRAATRAYVLVYNHPQSAISSLEALLEPVLEEAKRHGVGLLVAEKLDDYEFWETKNEAVRTEPAPDRLNKFIAEQLPEHLKNEIASWYHY